MVRIFEKYCPPMAVVGGATILVAVVLFAGPSPAPAGLIVLAGLAAAALVMWRLQRKVRKLEADRDVLADRAAALESREDLARTRYQHLLDHAGDALFYIDPATGSPQQINRQAEELLGYSAGEIRGIALADLFPGQQKRRYLRLVKTVLRDGYGEIDNLQFRRKDGMTFLGSVHVRLGRLGRQEVAHGVIRDVTERRRIEDALLQSNRNLTLLNEIAHSTATHFHLDEMLQTVLGRVVDSFAADGGGIYLVRESGTVLKLMAHLGMGHEVRDDLGQIGPDQGVVGRVIRSGLPKTSADLQHDRRVRFEVVRRAGWRGFQAIPLVTNERTVGALFLFQRERRTYRREEVNLLLAIGKQVGTAVVGADLFEALQWQNRLTQASNRELERSRSQLRKNLDRMAETNRGLERLDRMKSQFLALASHELRTPLTYVLSGSELLQERHRHCLNEEGRLVLGAIVQGGQRLHDVVGDLLEVARLESQTLTLAREPFDPAQVFAELAVEFQPRLTQRSLTLDLAPFPDGTQLLGDRHYLKKTFQRLLENAVKFTPAGGRIETAGTLLPAGAIRCRQPDLHSFSPAFFESPPEGPLLQVTISDNGVGINPEEHLQIFDKFYEVGEITSHFTSTSSFGGKGVGLGLALVKGMVEAHGGMVWVESPGTAPPGGSAFQLVFPLAPASDPATGEAGLAR